MYEPYADLGVFTEFLPIVAISLAGGLLLYLLLHFYARTPGLPRLHRRPPDSSPPPSPPRRAPGQGPAGRRPREAFLFKPPLVLVALILAYLLVFGFLSLRRHEAFHSHAYDLGIFDQVTWNTAHGRLFANTVMLEYTASLLGNHFSPIFLAIAPLYWLWADPRLLLLLQTLALGLGAVPVFLYARRRLNSPWLALAFAGAYLLFPALQYVNLFDFHEIALSVPLLGFALLYLTARRDKLFAAFLLLALLCREEVAFLAVTLGLYIIFGQRRWRFGLGITLLGVAWGVATIGFLVPHFQGAPDYYYVVRYGYLGGSLGEIVTTVLTRPLYVLEHLLLRGKIDFILRLLAPLALLPLAGWEFLAIAAPTFFYLLLSDYREQYSIFFQYSAPLIPFVFFAAVEGTRRVRAWLAAVAPAGWPANRPARWAGGPALAGCLLLAAVLSYHQYGPGPLAVRFHGERYASTAHNALGRALARQIPDAASVSAQSDLVPHVARRERIYTFPNLHSAEYVLLDANSIPWPLRQEDYAAAVDELKRNGLYQLTFAQDGYMLFQRRAQPSVDRVVNGRLPDGVGVLGLDFLPRGGDGGEYALAVYWRADESASPAKRLSTFVLWEDATGKTIARDEKEPAYWSLATDKWLAGEVVRIEYRLRAPSVPESGSRLRIGVRSAGLVQAESLERALVAGRAPALTLESPQWK